MFLGLVPITDTEDGNTELRLCVNLCAAERTATARQLPDGEPITVSYTFDPTDPLDQKRQEKRALKRAAFALMQRIKPTERPWGSLTGIRPTKLLRELLANENAL